MVNTKNRSCSKMIRVVAPTTWGSQPNCHTAILNSNVVYVFCFTNRETSVRESDCIFQLHAFWNQTNIISKILSDFPLHPNMLQDPWPTNNISAGILLSSIIKFLARIFFMLSRYDTKRCEPRKTCRVDSSAFVTMEMCLSDFFNLCLTLLWPILTFPLDLWVIKALKLLVKVSDSYHFNLCEKI